MGQQTSTSTRRVFKCNDNNKVYLEPRNLDDQLNKSDILIYNDVNFTYILSFLIRNFVNCFSLVFISNYLISYQ